MLNLLCLYMHSAQHDGPTYLYSLHTHTHARQRKTINRVKYSPKLVLPSNINVEYIFLTVLCVGVE